MSNLIKYNYVTVDPSDKRVIDVTDREALFQAITFRNEKKSKDNSSEAAPGEFVEGLFAPKVGVISEEELEEDPVDLVELEEKANNIIEEANAKAEEILNNAKQEAEIMRSQIQREAREMGYQTGLHQANEEIKEQEMQLRQQMEQNQREYEESVAALEPKFVDIMIAYIEKITGVVVSNRKDVILYLIQTAISGSEQSKSYMIKVSKADYDNVSSHWEDIVKLVKPNVEIELYEDINLEKNQCLIETSGSVIDCSLNVQLKNLITDLKLLAL